MPVDTVDNVMSKGHFKNNRYKQIESELRRLVSKMVKEFVKHMSQLPCLTIESRMESDTKVVEQITAWLFRMS